MTGPPLAPPASGSGIKGTPADAVRALQRPVAHLDLEHFEVVARADVVRVLQDHAAFQARAHFRHVVLEAPQRGDDRLRYDDVVAGKPGMDALLDPAFDDQQARRLVALAGRE